MANFCQFDVYYKFTSLFMGLFTGIYTICMYIVICCAVNLYNLCYVKSLYVYWNDKILTTFN